MREDQEVLLQQQREAIVQQVMQSLRDSGVVPSPDRVVSTRHSTRPHQKSGSGSPTGRLEQNLHSLVLHSLSESGLDFPHVQRTAYMNPHDAGAHEIRSSGTQGGAQHSVISSHREPVIIARQEGAKESSKHFADQSAEEFSEEKSDHIDEKQNGATRRSRDKRIPPRTFASIQESPLGTTNRRIEKHRKGRSKTSQHQRRAARNSRADDVDDASEYANAADPVEAEFNRIRNKVGHKTLAILEKTKALLNQTKGPNLPAEKGSGKNFVARLREMHVETDAASKGELDDDNHQENEANRHSGDEMDGRVDSDADSTHKRNPEIVPSLSADALKTPQSAQEVKKQKSESAGGEGSASIRCDIELLRPPESSPENENDWENELARQILTIYATSVKAKAAGVGNANTTSSNADEGRLSNRSIRSRPASGIKAATNGKKGGSLGSSCSLPVLNPRMSTSVPGNTNRQRSTASVHRSWEPSQRLQNGKVVINMPKVPRPIWFAGTGAVKAVWCALAQGFADLQPQYAKGSNTSSPGKAQNMAPIAMCEHRLCEEVRHMEGKHQFGQCIATLESLLITLVRARGVADLETKLWKQLVVTCNAFASRCIDYKKFTPALQLIKQAEQLIHNSILVDDGTRLELMAYLYDTYAHYYYRKQKAHAGLQYILKAHEIHSKQSNWSHLAKCRLHIANLLSYQLKHQDAMTYMASILEMIEENKLEEQSENGGGASAQKICLAAVCYNNLAVEQLHLREFEAASVSSANAKRLARLCLSYSNRWLSQFEATSNCAALAIATLMEDANAAKSLLMRNATPTLTE